MFLADDLKWLTRTKTSIQADSTAHTQPSIWPSSQRECSSWARVLSSYPISIPAHFGPSAHSSVKLPPMSEI